MGIIRLLLALSVVAAHIGAILGTNFVGGKIAVQSFFIISGFYMSLILNEKYTGVNNSYQLFISNRFLRLYPVYWVVLIMTVLLCVVAILLGKQEGILITKSYTSVELTVSSYIYLGLTNLLIFGQDVVTFMGIDTGNGNLYFTGEFWKSTPQLNTFLFIPQAWSLAIELMFYLIAPFILTKGNRLVVYLIIFSFLLRVWIFNFLGWQNDPWDLRFFPTEIFFFLCGYFSYRLYIVMQEKNIPSQLSYAVFGFVLISIVLFLKIPEIRIDYSPFSFNEIIYFFMLTISLPVIFLLFSKNEFDRQIGELSYPLYISHGLVAIVAASLHLYTSWILAVLALVFSFLLNKFIALPIEKYRQSRLKV